MLSVLAPGPMVTVQDAGRFGLGRAGVSAAGPMDPGLMRLANALTGNDPGAAALEFAGFGGRFEAAADLVIALAGDAPLTIGDRPAPAFTAHRIPAGTGFRIGALSGATWGYLAVAGGIATPPVMGSRATHLRFGLGRALAAGDRLPVGPAEPRRLMLDRPPLPGTGPLRVVLGPQADRFPPATLDGFLSAAFTVTAERDRMGMVLDGPPLTATSHDIVSDGTEPGAIQVPGSGRPIVLMAEAQTTGGYAKIACLIAPDRARLAQMPAGSKVRFAALDRDEAEDAVLAARAAEARMLAALHPVPEGAPSSTFLLSQNLAGAIWPVDAVVPDDP